MDLVTAGFLFLVSVTWTYAQNQCDISVLYESHCPDSRHFIHQELVPNWHKLEPHCTLDLVPFGKARSTGNGFTCQHGPKECRGNMIMSCGLKGLAPGRDQLNFVSCFMANPDDGGPECSRNSGLQWESIEACMQSEEGIQLQREAEEKSYPIRQSRFVPTVVMNKQFIQQDHNDAQNDLLKVACRKAIMSFSPQQLKNQLTRWLLERPFYSENEFLNYID